MLTGAYVGNRTAEIQAVRALPPGHGQVRIHVAFVGVCGTDLHIVHRSMDRRVQVPLIFGHEMSGTVDEVGGGVDGWATGDKVTVMPLAPASVRRASRGQSSRDVSLGDEEDEQHGQDRDENAQG